MSKDVCCGEVYLGEDYNGEFDAIKLQKNAAQKMMVLRQICNNGRQLKFSCDDEVDKILKMLKENGFTFIEAEYFFDFAKARLENSLLYQPLRTIEKYPAEENKESKAKEFDPSKDGVCPYCGGGVLVYDFVSLGKDKGYGVIDCSSCGRRLW